LFTGEIKALIANFFINFFADAEPKPEAEATADFDPQGRY
jgi:hypothetical protein